MDKLKSFLEELITCQKVLGIRINGITSIGISQINRILSLCPESLRKFGTVQRLHYLT